MGGADVFDIVFVEVRLHRDAVLPKRLVILRAGQRRQTEEFEKVDRQSSFMIAISRLIVSGVSAGKPRIYPAIVRIPCFFQASSILRYSVILFWRFLAAARLSGLMFSSPMKTLVTPARFAFSMKLGIL